MMKRESLYTVIGDIAAIAGSQASNITRAQEILGVINTHLPFAAACTTLVLPDGKLWSRLSSGYNGPLAAHFESEIFRCDLQELGLFTGAGSIKYSDVVRGESSLKTVDDYLKQSSYEEGVTTPLYNSMGRLVGFQNISFADAHFFNKTSQDLLDCVAPTLANLLDPLSLGNIVPGIQAHYLSLIAVDINLRSVALLGGVNEWKFDQKLVMCMLDNADKECANWLLLKDSVLHCVQIWRAGEITHGIDQNAIIIGDLGPADSPLTKREAEIARLVAQGFRNTDMAQMLGITLRTVNAHVEAIMLKLEVKNRAAATAIIVRKGWRLLC